MSQQNIFGTPQAFQRLQGAAVFVEKTGAAGIAPRRPPLQWRKSIPVSMVAIEGQFSQRLADGLAVPHLLVRAQHQLRVRLNPGELSVHPETLEPRLSAIKMGVGWRTSR